MLTSLAVLLTSIGVDIHTVMMSNRVDGAARTRPIFWPIGPRRYPPGYHATLFVSSGNSNASRASHQTVIKN
jgi:hypothetical protein